MVEMLLRRVCHPPEVAAAAPVGAAEQHGAALRLLREAVPQLSALVRGRRVADIGCGQGHEAIALAVEEGAIVWGIDLNPVWLAQGRTEARAAGLREGQAQFVSTIPDSLWGTCDVVISQNSFEHFSDPAAVLATMRRLLSPTGTLILTFGPPWFSPFGAHMNFFCPLPWVHLYVPERSVLNVRRAYRSDGATRYEDVEGGL